MSVPDPPSPSPHLAWLAKAKNDILNVDNNLAATQIPWDTVCFHCQQAAEKTLKGYLAYRGQPLHHTHDLVALLSDCAAIERSLASLQEDCQALTYYAVGVRYPDTMFEPDEADGLAMVAAMRRVRAVVLPLMSPPTPP